MQSHDIVRRTGEILANWRVYEAESVPFLFQSLMLLLLLLTLPLRLLLPLTTVRRPFRRNELRRGAAI